MTLIQLMYATSDDRSCCEPACCEGGSELFDEDDFVILTDLETGEEYPFMLVDTFEFESENYCVLIDPDDIEEEEVSLFFMKVTEADDGEEVLTGLDEDEDERVFAAYEKFMDERDEAEFED